MGVAIFSHLLATTGQAAVRSEAPLALFSSDDTNAESSLSYLSRFYPAEQATSISETGPAESRDLQLLTLRLSEQTSEDSVALLGAGISVFSAAALNRSSHWYGDVPEFWIRAGASDASARLWLGRRKMNWSDADTSWQLGLWQPRLRWDYLVPESIGLTGLFIDWKPSRQFSFTAFASPLFLPERGVSVQFDQGKAESSNEWFISPPVEGAVFSSSTPIRYRLSEFSLNELLLQNSIGLNGKWSSDSGAFAGISYAYKPLNQLLFAYDGYLQSTSSEVRILTTLHPRTLYHHLGSLDAGWTNAVWTARTSVIGESPEEESLPAEWNAQQASSAVALSPAIQWDGRWFVAGVNYLKVWGAEAADRGPESDGKNTRFEARYPFRSALGLKLNLWPDSQFSITQTLIQELDRSGSLFSATMNYRLSSRSSLTAGLDILGADGSDSFLGKHRANDRYYGGFRYVF